MPANLYETLGISRNATQEEIRRAYRRRALETHPDRLPQGASAAEKSAHEDSFRKVNNAYEVLSDAQSRAAYDQHGVWPPPSSSAPPFPNGPHESFSDPFFSDHFSHHFSRGPRMDPFGSFGPFGFGSRPNPRGFTDPFTLFNSIFGDFHRAFASGPFFDDPFSRRSVGSNPFGGGFFGNGFPSVMPSPFDYNGGGGSNSMQTFSSGGNGGRWVSESWTSSTVNGVTHTKCVRKDSQGNEHVTYRYPDGTERRTINGIEQSSSQPQRALPAPPAPYPNQVGSMPPPPPYSEVVGQSPHRSRSSRHHGHYDDHYGDRRDHRDRYRHDYDNEWGGHGYRDDGYGHDAQNGPSWTFWRS